MLYCLAFLLFGVVLIWSGLDLHWPGLGLIWAGLSCILIGMAYGGVGPRLLGKRVDGRIAVWAYLTQLPYFAATWILWHLVRIFGREDASNEISPGLWLGRRPLHGELPANTGWIVDLTAEFPVDQRILTGLRYTNLPVLDTGVPAFEPFLQLAEEIAQYPGTVMIHCAAGHGRSAMMVAAVLIRRGIAKDGNDAEARIREKRPRARLNSQQRKFLEQLGMRSS